MSETSPDLARDDDDDNQMEEITCSFYRCEDESEYEYEYESKDELITVASLDDDTEDEIICPLCAGLSCSDVGFVATSPCQRTVCTSCLKAYTEKLYLKGRKADHILCPAPGCTKMIYPDFVRGCFDHFQHMRFSGLELLLIIEFSDQPAQDLLNLSNTCRAFRNETEKLWAEMFEKQKVEGKSVSCYGKNPKERVVRYSLAELWANRFEDTYVQSKLSFSPILNLDYFEFYVSLSLLIVTRTDEYEEGTKQSMRWEGFVPAHPRSPFTTLHLNLTDIYRSQDYRFPIPWRNAAEQRASYCHLTVTVLAMRKDKPHQPALVSRSTISVGANPNYDHRRSPQNSFNLPSLSLQKSDLYESIAGCIMERQRTGSNGILHTDLYLTVSTYRNTTWCKICLEGPCACNEFKLANQFCLNVHT